MTNVQYLRTWQAISTRETSVARRTLKNQEGFRSGQSSLSYQIIPISGQLFLHRPEVNRWICLDQ